MSPTCVCLAESNANVTGFVKDTQQQPVIGASVTLLKYTDSRLVKAAITDEQGMFDFTGIGEDGYSLAISAAGFNNYKIDSIYLSGQLTLPDIALQVVKTLNGITITAQKPLIEMQQGKLIVNVENSMVNTGATVLEVLGRSPGVTVDQSENIWLKGRNGVTIMIDGKITALQGSDLAALLKSMPSTAIEKIEIISNPGARYDAAGTAGIINLKTKRDKRSGLNGSTTLSYGQGRYHKANAGTILSYRTKKIALNGGYNYSNRTNFNSLAIVREFYKPDGSLQTRYDQEGVTLYPVRNHNANLALDYFITKKTTIGVSANGDIAHFNPKGDNFSRVDSNNTYTFFSTSNRSQDKWYNYGVNTYLRHEFDTSGRTLEINIDYARFWNSTNQLYTNKYYTKYGDMLLRDYILLGKLNGLTQVRAAKADYSQLLPLQWKLDAGWKSSLVTADNALSFYDHSTIMPVFDSSKSNHFIYLENITAAYINLSKDVKKWSYQLGLRGEQTIAKGNQVTTNIIFHRNYFQLFPSIATQYHLNKEHEFGLSLSRRIDRPSYKQLNPFRYFLDPTNSRIGNPYLNPTLTYSVELSHTYKQRFVNTLTYSRGSNIIIETLEADTLHENQSINSDKNLATLNYYAYTGTYQFNIAKWWNTTTNITVYYGQYIGSLSNTPINKGRFALELNTTNTYTLGKGFTAEISMYYQTPSIWGYYEFKSISSINVGLQKSLIDKKATLKLNATDLMRLSSPRALMKFDNFRETFTALRDTRVLTISFVYRFGNNQQSLKRHKSGAEDEKRRAG